MIKIKLNPSERKIIIISDNAINDFTFSFGKDLFDLNKSDLLDCSPDEDWGLRMTEDTAEKVLDLLAEERKKKEEKMKQKAICFSELKRHCEAVEEIDDEYILKLIAESGGHNAVRWTAIDKIEDEEFLKEFFNKKIESTYGYSQNITDNELRWKCLKKITDQKFLKKVALDTTESGITRGVAIQRIDISEQELFEDLYNKDCDPTVQFYAIRKLTNKHLLHYIAECEEYTDLQAEGRKRLKELRKRENEYITAADMAASIIDSYKEKSLSKKREEIVGKLRDLGFSKLLVDGNSKDGEPFHMVDVSEIPIFFITDNDLDLIRKIISNKKKKMMWEENIEQRDSNIYRHIIENAAGYVKTQCFYVIEK